MVSCYEDAFPLRICPLKVVIPFRNNFHVEVSAVLSEGIQKKKEHNFIRAVKVFDRLFLVCGGTNKERYCCACQQQRSLKTILPRHDSHRHGEATLSRTNETS